jgi:thioredoxin reductase
MKALIIGVGPVMLGAALELARFVACAPHSQITTYREY